MSLLGPSDLNINDIIVIQTVAHHQGQEVESLGRHPLDHVEYSIALLQSVRVVPIVANVEQD